MRINTTIKILSLILWGYINLTSFAFGLDKNNHSTLLNKSFCDLDNDIITAQIIKNNYKTNSRLTSQDSIFERSIEARDGISLTNVQCLEEARCSMGSFFADRSNLNKVIARDGVTLTDTTAKDVSVSMGNIIWRNSEYMDLPARSIEARDGISLTNVQCLEEARCSMGSFFADRSNLNKVIARDGVTLTDTTAEDVSVSMGNVVWRNSEYMNLPARSIQARDRISLTNVQCLEKTECSMGKIIAKNCMLTDIFARKEISLTNTTINSAVLNVYKGRRGLITLKDSIVEGDLHIEELFAICFFDSTIKLEIRGGLIKGNVIFHGCKGSVILSEKAELLGEIIGSGEE